MSRREGAATGVGSARLRRPRAITTLRLALMLLVGAAVLVCALEIPLLRYPDPGHEWLLGLLAITGVVYVVIGAVAWDRRPSNRMGSYLCLVGFLQLIARLSAVQDPALATIGAFTAQVPIAAVLHLMLLFPSGRLRGRLDRLLVVAGYLVMIGFAIPFTLFRPADASGALVIADRPDIIIVLQRWEPICWLVVLIAAAVLLVKRLRTQRAVLGERRARIAVYSVGIFSVLFLPFAAGVLGRGLGWSEMTVFILQVGAIMAVPLAFGGSLLIGGYARTAELDELGAWLGSPDSGRIPLRQMLADALGDESLLLLFRRSDGPGLIDTEGRPVDEPVARAPVGLVTVEMQGVAAGVIVYDTSAVADPSLVEAAGRIVAVAIERDRLTAELLAEREALKRSRTRIVEVGDLERRRFARDLHDLLQSRLVLAAMHAGTLAVDAGGDAALRNSADRLRVDLEGAITELRRLVHGVLPALLLERGLPAAATDLVERCLVPTELRMVDVDQTLPASVSSSAYFLLAEALANAVKHSRASSLRVVIEKHEGDVHLEISDDGIGGATMSGSGLRGMADRVEALGGRFHLVSRPGAGTTISATLPCERRTSVPV